MLTTPEQEEIGRDNFNGVVGAWPNRREFIAGAAAAGSGLGALYFGYKKLTGDPVRVAFIGTGDEGNVLINEHPTDFMKIVAIADLRPANIKRTFVGSHPVARRGLNAVLGPAADDVKTFTNHRDLLAQKDELGIEAVVIAVPLNQHAPVALECMEAGLHVLCEKLMARTIMDCKKMIRTAEEKGLMLAVGHQRHYSVLYENANHLVREGVLGDIKYIRAQWHRNNSFPGRDQWHKWEKAAKEDIDFLTKNKKMVEEFGYPTPQHLVDWRLYNLTGGGLMAELGSHQMDAASIFLGKVHPVAVQGFGGRNYYGIPNVGPEDKWKDDREIDDQIFVQFEFPGKTHPKNPNWTGTGDEEDRLRDLCMVTYSSISTNRWEPYGEAVFGTRGTLVMKTEKEALFYKEASAGGKGGLDQRLWVLQKDDGGPVVDTYETTAPTAAVAKKAMGGDTISRGYREEMEHFCHCIRTGNNDLRCNGTVAMADAIMALTANIAMKKKIRIEFKDEWFDAKSDETPEKDFDVELA